MRKRSAVRYEVVDKATYTKGRSQRVGRFSWIATAPATPGLYTEYYNALAEGVNWIPPDNGRPLNA